MESASSKDQLYAEVNMWQQRHRSSLKGRQGTWDDIILKVFHFGWNVILIQVRLW